MRRLKRAILRHRAEKKGLKPSRYVREIWHKLQEKRYGKKMARIFQGRGTRKKRNWHY